MNLKFLAKYSFGKSKVICGSKSLDLGVWKVLFLILSTVSSTFPNNRMSNFCCYSSKEFIVYKMRIFSTFYWSFLDSSERFVHSRILLLHSICHSNLYSFIEELMTDKKFMNLAKDFAALKLVLNWKKVCRRWELNPGPSD